MLSQADKDLIDRSFLARIPALMTAGLPYEEALKQARADDDRMCWALIDAERHYSDGSRAVNSPMGDVYAEAKRLLCLRVYRKIRNEA